MDKKDKKHLKNEETNTKNSRDVGSAPGAEVGDKLLLTFP